MKYYIPALALVFFLTGLSSGCKSKQTPDAKSRVTVDNDKVKVTEYVGDPSRYVCGEGMHHHGPHLTVLLTDADVEETKEDGKKEVSHALKGFSFWSEGSTHSVINIGKKPIRSMIVEVKSPVKQ